MCVSFAFPYLKPGGDSESWRRAVRCGIIKYAESIELLKTMGVRKYAMRDGENVNGTVLRLCLPRYEACCPQARKGFVAQCHSLLHPSRKGEYHGVFRPGAFVPPFPLGVCKKRVTSTPSSG